MDLNLPECTAIGDRLRSASPDLPILVITAVGTSASAIDAMKQGAYDYLSKPWTWTWCSCAWTRRLRRPS